MAKFPRPLGIEHVLEDIAIGIGAAARTLPERSRSVVGAVAMKTAKVRIDFEMATADSVNAVGVVANRPQLGIAAGLGTGAAVSRAASRGFIEFEVVAIADIPEPAPPKPARRKRPRQAAPVESSIPPADSATTRLDVLAGGLATSSGPVDVVLAHAKTQVLPVLSAAVLTRKLTGLRSRGIKAKLVEAKRSELGRLLVQAGNAKDTGDLAAASKLVRDAEALLAAPDTAPGKSG
ncbi:MAG TPA: hypothetical protein VGW40_12665 [Allosphingosinicella sp.]|nr:hypothetical protein [Allosphingosinicella sp.]